MSDVGANAGDEDVARARRSSEEHVEVFLAHLFDGLSGVVARGRDRGVVAAAAIAEAAPVLQRERDLPDGQTERALDLPASVVPSGGALGAESLEVALALRPIPEELVGFDGEGREVGRLVAALAHDPERNAHDRPGAGGDHAKREHHVRALRGHAHGAHRLHVRAGAELEREEIEVLLHILRNHGLHVRGHRELVVREPLVEGLRVRRLQLNGGVGAYVLFFRHRHAARARSGRLRGVSARSVAGLVVPLAARARRTVLRRRDDGGLREAADGAEERVGGEANRGVARDREHPGKLGRQTLVPNLVVERALVVAHREDHAVVGHDRGVLRRNEAAAARLGAPLGHHGGAERPHQPERDRE